VDASDSPDSRYHPPEYGILFWNLTDRRWDVPRIQVPSPPCHLSFTPDGHRLAIATSPEDDEHVQVLMWELDPVRWSETALSHIAYKPPQD
jgi:hypothetical protein